jgi:heat shock protein HtpX
VRIGKASAYGGTIPEGDDLASGVMLALGFLVIVFGMFFLWRFVMRSYVAVVYGTPTDFDDFVVHGRTFFLNLPVTTMAGLVFGGVSAWWSNRRSADAILGLGGLYEAKPQADWRDKKLVNVVEEMSIAAGLPVPRVYILPDADPNAFSLGISASGACIVVTTGLIERLDREELQAVIAHEMSHIKNLDTRVMTLMSVLFGSVLVVSAAARRGMLFGGSLEKRKLTFVGGTVSLILTIVWFLFVLLSPIAAKILAMAVSRNREYLADATAADLTRNPMALVSALEKVESAVAPTRSVRSGFEHLCIVDPRGSRENEKEGFLADLLATHPPLRKRVMYLKAMAYAV